MSDKKSRDGPLSGIPKKLPMLRLVAAGQVIFPGINLSIGFSDEQVPSAYRDKIRSGLHLVLAVLAPDQSSFNVAILGKTTFEGVKGKKNLASFMGLCRVHYQIVAGDREGNIVRWYPLNELPIPPEVLKDPEFLNRMLILKEHYAALVVQLKEELGERAEEFFGLEKIKELLLVIQNVNFVDNPSCNLNILIDSILNFLNNAAIITIFAQKGITFWVPSLSALEENDPMVRLETTENILDVLSRVLRGEDVLGQDEDNLAESQVGSSNKDGSNARQPGELSGKKNGQDGRTILQAQLKRPFEVQPRFISHSTSGDPPADLISLDWRTPSVFTERAISFFDQHIVGQKRAKIHLAKKLVLLKEGLADPRRPVVGGFCAGGTGIGKTESVKALAKFLFDDFEGYTHVPCNIFHSEHEASFLIGAPPGYVGYREEPRLSQWRVDSPHFIQQVKEQRAEEIKARKQEIKQLEEQLQRSTSEEERKRILAQLRPKHVWLKKIFSQAGYVPGKCFSIILWDEIEKAPPQFFNVLLQVLDDGKLQLLNGEITDLRHSIFFFTSNIYGAELQKESSGKGVIGIRPQNGASLRQEFDRRIWRETINAIERFFSINPAFLGRIGKENIVVFHPLEKDHLLKILENIYFPEFLVRLQQSVGIENLSLTEKVKEFIVEEALDPTNRALGARALHKVFGRLVEEPIGLLCSKGSEGDGIVSGDKIWVDVAISQGGSREIVISKEPRGSS